MKVKLIILTILFTAIVMSGCAPRYSCKEVVPGTRCASLSEVYHEQVTGMKVLKDKEKVSSEEKAIKKKQGNAIDKAELLVAGQKPILRPPKIVRIWIAPWVDGNEDLNMDTYIYTEIREKKWMLGEISNSSGMDTSSENTGRIINVLE